MPSRDLTEADLTRSSKNGAGASDHAPPKPLPGIGRPQGRRRTRDSSTILQGATTGVLPGRQVKQDVDRFLGYLSPLDPRRRSLAQDEDTIDAIRAVRDVDPQVGNAVWNMLRLINPGHDLRCKTYDAEGNEDEEAGAGQALLDALAVQVGKEYGGGLDQLHNVLALVLMTNGAAAIEVEVNSTLTGVIDWHPVDPLVLSFRREEEEDGVKRLHLGQDVGTDWERLNEKQVFYFPLDPDIDDPYGRPPMVAAVQQVLFLAQLQADTRAMAHQQGFPRLDIQILWEQIQQAAPPTVRDDPTAFQEWANQQLGAIVGEYEDLNADDVFIHYDFVKVGTAGGGAGSFNFEALDKILTRRLTMSLKALPITLGINDSTSETHGSIQWQIQVAGIQNFQRGVKRLIEKAANLSLRVAGIQAHAKLEYDEIRTVDRLYETQSDMFDRKNAQFDVMMGWIPNSEASNRIVGHDPVEGAELMPPPPPGAVPPEGEQAEGEWWEGTVPEQGGGGGGDEEPWWGQLFNPDSVADKQGKQDEKQPADVSGYSRGDLNAGFKMLLEDMKAGRYVPGERQVSGPGRRGFRGLDGRDRLIAAIRAGIIGDDADPLNDVARFAEAGETAFLRIKEDVLEQLVAEGLVDQRDVASDISATFQRSLAREMKGILRRAVRDGAGIVDPKVKAPESLIDRIWKRNQQYVRSITGDLAAAIRSGQVGSVESLINWFQKNAYRERLMGRHMGKQGLTAGFAYAADKEDMGLRWTRTITESCDTCVDRGGTVYRYEELVSIGFPGSDSLLCGANCQCILMPVEGRAARHYGPGDHADGSSQKVHGGGGDSDEKPGAQKALDESKKESGTVGWNPDEYNFGEKVEYIMALEHENSPDTEASADDLPYGANMGKVYYDSNMAEYASEHGVVYNGPDGKPAGLVLFVDYKRDPTDAPNSRWRKIAQVQVLPKYRGKGIGRAMYDWIQDETDINLYDYIGQSKSFTPAGKDFAVAWLEHRIKLEGGARSAGTLDDARQALAAVLAAPVSSIGLPSPEEPAADLYNARHYGPGDHPDGSSQKVHAGDKAKDETDNPENMTQDEVSANIAKDPTYTYTDIQGGAADEIARAQRLADTLHYGPFKTAFVRFDLRDDFDLGTAETIVNRLMERGEEHPMSAAEMKWIIFDNHKYPPKSFRSGGDKASEALTSFAEVTKDGKTITFNTQKMSEQAGRGDSIREAHKPDVSWSSGGPAAARDPWASTVDHEWAHVVSDRGGRELVNELMLSHYQSGWDYSGPLANPNPKGYISGYEASTSQSARFPSAGPGGSFAEPFAEYYRHGMWNPDGYPENKITTQSVMMLMRTWSEEQIAEANP